MCTRTVVPADPDLICTRSPNWCTSHRPRRRSVEAGSGRTVPTSGSAIRPVSLTWQMTSPSAVHMVSLPGPSVCSSVLAASSAAAMTRSLTLFSATAGPLGLAGDEPAHRGLLVTEQQLSGPDRRAAQRLVRLRPRSCAAEQGAVQPVALAHQHRMSGLRHCQQVRVESGVVGA